MLFDAGVNAINDLFLVILSEHFFSLEFLIYRYTQSLFLFKNKYRKHILVLSIFILLRKKRKYDCALINLQKFIR